MNQTLKLILFSSLTALNWLIISRTYLFIALESRDWAFFEPTFWLVVALLLTIVTVGFFIIQFNKNFKQASRSKKILNGVLISICSSLILLALRLVLTPLTEQPIHLKSLLLYVSLGTLAAVATQLNIKYLFEKDSR